MSVYDITSGSTATGPFSGFPGEQPVKVLLDFAKLGIDNTTKADITSLGYGDTLKILNIPIGTVVKGVTTRVIKPASHGVSSTGGGTQTVKIAIGDAGGTTRYNTEINISAAAGTTYYGDASTGGTFASLVSYPYTAAGVLQIIPAENVSDGQIEIRIDTRDEGLAAPTALVGIT